LAALQQNLTQAGEGFAVSALETVAEAGASLLDLFIVFFLAYLWAADAEGVGPKIVSWAPTRHQSRSREILELVEQRLADWARAQVLISLFYATMFVAGLWLLGVPYALSIGVLGGVLSIIPYFGMAIAALLAVLSALAITPMLALWVALYFFAVTFVGGHLVTPVLYGRATGLNTVIVLLALLVGAKLQGITGMIFAVPVAVIATTVLQVVGASSEVTQSVETSDDLEE
jgi:predicted PurR-regulated permease PerM